MPVASSVGCWPVAARNAVSSTRPRSPRRRADRAEPGRRHRDDVVPDAQRGLDRELQEPFRTTEIAWVGTVLVQRDLGEVTQDPNVVRQHGELRIGAFGVKPPLSR